ncbi:MAG TPA: GNAT family N-acetyltransferase [Rummeliibacillus sp.]|nr:GNAT family N-acetyltransferase [Rummeliibacillus sp.]
MFYFRKANTTDLSSIMNIISEAQQFLKEHGINQWQDGYPSEDVIALDIENQIAYVLLDEGRIVATVAIDPNGEEAYNDLEGGHWLSQGQYLAIHRLAVLPTYNGNGLATIIIQEVEKLCTEKQIHSLRLDTHMENKAMQRVAEKNHFTKCGIVYYDGSPRI